jgi:hypothetical protein
VVAPGITRFEAQYLPGAVDREQDADDVTTAIGRAEQRASTLGRADRGNAAKLRLVLVTIAVRQPRTRRSRKINMSGEMGPYRAIS